MTRTMLYEDLYDEGKDVVDIGCGNGLFTRNVAAKFGTVTSIDINPARVANLAAYCAEHGIGNVRAVVMDAHRLEFPDDSFDAALLYRAVDHIPEYRAALSEACRVLALGGTVYVNVQDTRRDTVAIRNMDALRAFEDELYVLLGIGDGMCEVVPVDIEMLKRDIASAGFEAMRDNVVENEEGQAETYFRRIVDKTEELLGMMRERLPERYEDKRRAFASLFRQAASEGVDLRPTFEAIARKTVT